MVQVVTKKASLNLNAVATDITKFGAPAVTIFEVLVNTLPKLSLNSGDQAILSAVIALLTTVLSFSKANAVAKASPVTTVVR